MRTRLVRADAPRACPMSMPAQDARSTTTATRRPANTPAPRGRGMSARSARVRMMVRVVTMAQSVHEEK
eukprot:300408-Prymnesium_polylepis.1